MLTPHGTTFSITSRGQQWRGTWELDGREVRVSSAFGSARVAKGRTPADRVAEAAMLELVNQWIARQ